MQIPIDEDLSERSTVTGVKNFGKRLMNRDIGSAGIVIIEVQPRGSTGGRSGIKLR